MNTKACVGISVMMPETVPPMSHTFLVRCNGTCTTKRNNLAESTGVVPAKHPPKVKLELFSLL